MSQASQPASQGRQSSQRSRRSKSQPRGVSQRSLEAEEQEELLNKSFNSAHDDEDSNSPDGTNASASPVPPEPELRASFRRSFGRFSRRSTPDPAPAPVRSPEDQMQAALVDTARRGRYTLLSVMHGRNLLGFIQFHQTNGWAHGVKQQNETARAFIVVLDSTDVEDMGDLRSLMTAFKEADLQRPVFAVQFAQETRNMVEERQQQVWEVLSTGVADFIKQIDGDFFDSIEMALMLINIQNNHQRDWVNQLVEDLEESRNQIDYMLWQWIPSQLRLNIPGIDLNLVEAPDGSVNELQFMRALGRGAFGMVHEARTPTGQTLAVKLLRKDNAPTIGQAERIYREIQILEAIPRHPHLAQLHFVLHSIDTIYICLAYGGPQNLYHLQRRQTNRAFTYELCQEIFGQIADAVGHMHRNTFYHRDIKPENIAVDGDVANLDRGAISTMLVDCGLAVNSTRPLRQLCGSLPFAAPEILDEPCRYYGGPVDAFALGMLLFELVRGQSSMESLLEWNSQTQPSPFRARQLRTLLANGPPSINRRREEPHAVTQLFTGLLQTEPSRRNNLVEVLRSPWLTTVAAEQHMPHISQ